MQPGRVQFQDNQFTIPGEDGKPGTTIEIPPTLLITGMGIVPNINQCVTSDAKSPGNHLVLVGACNNAMGGSHYQQLFGTPTGGDPSLPRVDLDLGPKTAQAVHKLIKAGLVGSAHDVSDGGVLVAIAEMLIGGSSTTETIGFQSSGSLDVVACFAQSPSCYLLEVTDPRLVIKALGEIPCSTLGVLTDSGSLCCNEMCVGIDQLTDAWRSTLDWS
ncbi:MAG: hypothetical protein JKY96_03575 [Phycisphaerales bacterium]|nr:hypothetical protein [Phycisphaerales bacterium]